MKNNEMLIERVISEVKEELNSLLKIRDEYREFIEKYSYIDRFLLRAKASLLSDFYMGIEKTFKIIAEEINGGIPKGEDWHKRLLLDMTLNIGERPPVISKDLYNKLLKFLGFRHVVRHAYGFELNEKKLEDISAIFEPVLDEFINEVEGFCNFLRS